MTNREREICLGCGEYLDECSCLICAKCERTIAELRAQLAAAEAERDRLREVCAMAWEHVNELRDAWQKGALHDRDGKGGRRSNRNVDVEVALRPFALEPGGER